MSNTSRPQKYRPVPVSAAKAIADAYDKTQVVILAYDPAHKLTHTTTYGVSAVEKEQAAAVGELCNQVIGCDLDRRVDYEDFHKDYDPALLKEATEILLWIRNHHGTTPHMLQRIERWCKTAGHTLRRA